MRTEKAADIAAYDLLVCGYFILFRLSIHWLRGSFRITRCVHHVR